MTFWPQCGADKSISSLSNFPPPPPPPPHHDRFIMIPCMSDMVEYEIQRLGASLKCSRQFGLSFAYDAPKIMNDLPNDVCSAISLLSFRQALQSYLFAKAYPYTLALDIFLLCTFLHSTYIAEY